MFAAAACFPAVAVGLLFEAAPELKLVMAPGLRSCDEGLTDNNGLVDLELDVSGTWLMFK